MPYTIVNADGIESGHYTGRTPRQAALKAVKALQGTKESPVIFRLRELGVKNKLHVFRGYTAMEKAPEKRPAWMKEIVKVAHVEKVGVEKIDELDRVKALIGKVYIERMNTKGVEKK